MGYRFRYATPQDMPVLLAHRKAMFIDTGQTKEGPLAAMLAASEAWMRRAFEEGRYVGFFFLDEADQVVAGASLWFTERPPSVRDPNPTRGHILNVYTAPEHRRRGLASQLVQMALDYCRQKGVSVVTLNASEEGRHIYEKLGFKPSNEMRMFALGDKSQT
jgi:ribosomal protein S18 acetylase RimI-like enzyme